VRGNENVLVLVPSVAVKVMVAVPSLVVTEEGRFAPGVITRVLLVAAFVPGPVTERLPINPEMLSSLLAAVTVSLSPEVKTELTLKALVNGTFSGVVWAPTKEMVGALVTIFSNQPPEI
jgi:hypothetical protein